MSYYFLRMIKRWSKTSCSRTLLTMGGSKMDWKFPAASFAFFQWMDVTLYVCRFQFLRNLTCAEWLVEDHAQTRGDLVLHSFMSWGGIPSGPSAFDLPSLFGQLITSPTDTSACKCSVIAISKPCRLKHSIYFSTEISENFAIMKNVVTVKPLYGNNIGNTRFWSFEHT